MRKGELVADFAERAKLSAAAANHGINTLTEIINERLKKGDTVGITGFGAFSAVKRAARKDRHPAAGGGDRDRAIEGAEILGRRDAARRARSRSEMKMAMRIAKILTLCCALALAGCGVMAAPCRVASAGIKMVPLVGHAAALPTDACAAVIDP